MRALKAQNQEAQSSQGLDPLFQIAILKTDRRARPSVRVCLSLCAARPRVCASACMRVHAHAHVCDVHVSVCTCARMRVRAYVSCLFIHSNSGGEDKKSV